MQGPESYQHGASQVLKVQKLSPGPDLERMSCYTSKVNRINYLLRPSSHFRQNSLLYKD